MASLQDVIDAMSDAKDDALDAEKARIAAIPSQTADELYEAKTGLTNPSSPMAASLSTRAGVPMESDGTPYSDITGSPTGLSGANSTATDAQLLAAQNARTPGDTVAPAIDDVEKQLASTEDENDEDDGEGEFANPDAPGLGGGGKANVATLPSDQIPMQAVGSGGTTSPINTDYIGSLLGKLYGSNTNDAALQNSIQQRNSAQSAAMMNLAGHEISSALSRGAIGVNPLFPEMQMQRAGQPVSDVLMQRQAKMQQLESGLKASDLEDKGKLRDPNSTVSAAYRQMALQMNPKLSGVPNFSSLDAEGVKSLQPMVDMSIRMQMLQQNREMMNQYKVAQDSAKAKADMANHITMAMNRGPNAVAGQGVLSGQKIMDLFKDQPDPSSWGPSKIAVFKAEAIKLASGGIGTTEDRQGLIPPNLAMGLSRILSGITSNSISSNQGDFIKSLVPYIQNMQQTSQDYIRKNVLNPVTSGYSKRVAPDDMIDYKMNSPYFPELQPGGYVPSSPQQGAGTALPSSDAIQAEMKKRGLSQ